MVLTMLTIAEKVESQQTMNGHRSSFRTYTRTWHFGLGPLPLIILHLPSYYKLTPHCTLFRTND